ncbi:hypothetical protein ACH5AO_33025 [Streptomyces sp. NPDC018964]|uniref:hypothetical protein n=1 Tax=unclassified Streptomyces TaxID=2593676 RepID=UPI0037A6D7C7
MAPGAMSRWTTSLSEARPVSYRLDAPGGPGPEPALTGAEYDDRPETYAWTGIALTKWSPARADARAGRRDPWLRTMDRPGLGFDS